MSDLTPGIPQTAPSEEALEAYILGRASDVLARQVEAWAAANPQHANRMAALRKEIARTREVLSLLSGGGDESLEALEERLARYLDGSLEPAARTQLERLLTGHPALQARLIHLFREGHAAMNESETIETVEYRPAGERIDFEAARPIPADPEAALSLEEAPEPDSDSKTLKQRLSPGQS